MDARIDTDYQTDGNLFLESVDNICDTLYGGQFKYSLLNGLLTLAGGRAGKTYELR